MPRYLSSVYRLAATLGLATSIIAQAELVQADEVGRMEYMYNCASCHGESGLGDGPVARYLNVHTPGLTTLAAENDGIFPLLEVIQVIDGRSGVGPHGNLMPVWGARFMASEIHDAGPYGAEVIVRGRVLSLAQYLESIQD